MHRFFYSASDPFVGRDRELQILLDHAAIVEKSAGRIDLVTGEPGIGKSRLVGEFANLLESFSVCIGRCVEGGAAPAYWPWIRILSEIASKIDLEAFGKQATCRPGYLFQFDPGTFAIFASFKERLSDVAGTEDNAGQFYLFQSVLELIVFAAAVQPLCIVIEDLHWADEGTCKLIEFLTPEVGAYPHMR